MTTDHRIHSVMIIVWYHDNFWKPQAGLHNEYKVWFLKKKGGFLKKHWWGRGKFTLTKLWNLEHKISVIKSGMTQSTFLSNV